MTDIYLRITDGTNMFIFTGAPTGNDTRNISEIQLPFFQNSLISDQISTGTIITLNYNVNPGTNKPYANVKEFLTMRDSILSSSRSTGYVLEHGDWDGSTFTKNNSYPFNIGSGNTKFLIENFTWSMAVGEPYDTGEIQGTITIKYGLVV